LNKLIINKIAELTGSPKKIAIIMHVNPDGDAVGASLALYGILTREKHQVTVITPNEYPSFLAWMPYCNNILIHRFEPQKTEEAIMDADLIFCLDFNDLNRMEKLAEAYKKSNAIKFLIDHHLSPSVFTDYTISESKTSSTSELIFDLLVALNKKHLLNKDIAECMYVGIVTDTGSFSYACNYEKTYLIISELFSHGIDGENIHRLVYDTYSEKRMRLLGYCLSEKLKVFQEYHTAYISLTNDDLKRFDYNTGDSEGIVNYALSIEGITMAALFIERGNLIKVSLRSKGNVQVNDIAREYYKGGGHYNAAGGNSYKSIDETLDEFEKRLPYIMNGMIE